jgi:hypothetical protein
MHEHFVRGSQSSGRLLCFDISFLQQGILWRGHPGFNWLGAFEAQSCACCKFSALKDFFAGFPSEGLYMLLSSMI